MQYRKPQKVMNIQCRQRAHHILKFLSHCTGLSMLDLLDMAVREFAARRLPANWETEKGGEYEEFKEEAAPRSGQV